MLYIKKWEIEDNLNRVGRAADLVITKSRILFFVVGVFNWFFHITRQASPRVHLQVVATQVSSHAYDLLLHHIPKCLCALETFWLCFRPSSDILVLPLTLNFYTHNKINNISCRSIFNFVLFDLYNVILWPFYILLVSHMCDARNILYIIS